MDVSSVAAIVAAIASWAAVAVALIAIRPARRSAKASEEQTDIQREIARQSAQPYVWADIQPDRQQGTLIHLIVGNSGPTVARNVRVTIVLRLRNVGFKKEFFLWLRGESSLGR